MNPHPQPSAPSRRTPEPERGPLSERATVALVRRTLCPRPGRSGGRDPSPALQDLLPPLTSRNDVDLELYALLAILLRDLVQSWYAKLTTDESFVAELVHLVAHCTRALEQRLRKLDLALLLLDEMPRLLDRHITTYRAAHPPPAAMPTPALVPREAYHALWPLPSLAPPPQPGKPERETEQEANEAAYRQLLAHAVLAVLLPTEDLENGCLTALVGQILSDFLIGNLIAARAAQPWFLFECICIFARLANEKETGSNEAATRSPGAERRTRPPMRHRLLTSLHGILAALAQLFLIGLSALRLLIWTVAMSSSLPPLPKTSPQAAKAAHPSRESPQPTTSRVPVLAFGIWRCAAHMVELDSRMPWLGGFFSLLQQGAIHGPGRLAGPDGPLDRLLSHEIHSSFSADRIPPALRSLRGALFPNNAPGTSTLAPPSSEAELRALRRRAAVALGTLLPSTAARLYLSGRLRGAGGDNKDDGLVDELEHLLLVFDDAYCNKHLIYSLLELVLVRLMPELSEKGVAELWEERLG